VHILTGEPRGIYADTWKVSRVSKENVKPYVALSLSTDPGQWEIRQIDGNDIYSDFISEYLFEKDGNYWKAQLRIIVSDLGIPTLREVHVFGYDELYEWDYTILELDPKTLKTPTVTNVERWQLNLVTQFRHLLLKDAITHALNCGVDTSERPGITATELKALEKKIDKTISKRVVTDDLLKQVALTYSDAVRNGLGDPIAEVMALTNRSYRRSQEYVQMCREKRLLPETTPGKVTINKPKGKKGK
jgi:hypothetical protein